MVKEQVYEPDWRTEERRDYTKQVADILADICPPRGHARRFRPRRSASSRTSPARTSSTATPSTCCGSAAHLVQIERAPATWSRWPRARAALLSRNDRRDDRLLHRAPLHRQGGGAPAAAGEHPDGHGDRRAAPPPRRRRSTSATRRSASRTSRCRCRSWSTRAFRSSSCRKSRRCTSAKSPTKRWRR